MRVLGLFSGIGGFELGLQRAGMEIVRMVEIDPYCRAVLRKHWPDVRIDEDVTTAEYEEGEADVICAGWPCQDLSVAGRGAGLAGERSGLWREVVRAAGVARPWFVLLENVAALTRRGLGDVLCGLAALGYDAEWHCIPASHLGAPHRRDRIFIIAHAVRRERRAEPYSGALGRMGRFLEPLPWDEPWAAALARFRRMADGVPRRVERTDCLRNAVVPQIPEMIGRAIMEARG